MIGCILLRVGFSIDKFPRMFYSWVSQFDTDDFPERYVTVYQSSLEKSESVNRREHFQESPIWWFPIHRGTPSHHPFYWDFPWNKPSIIGILHFGKPPYSTGRSQVSCRCSVNQSMEVCQSAPAFALVTAIYMGMVYWIGGWISLCYPHDPNFFVGYTEVVHGFWATYKNWETQTTH